MALDDIFKALEDQADKEIQEMLQDARDQATAIDEDANDEAKALRERLVSDMEKATNAEGTRTTNAARLDSKKQVAAVKQEAVVEAFDLALAELVDERSKPQYAEVFTALAVEAAEGLEGEIEVLVDPADVALAEKVFADMDVPVTIRGDIETAGGLILLTHEGRIMRRNTFEERLDKVRSIVQSDVAEILFA